MCRLTQNMWKMQLMIKLDEQIPKNIIIKKPKHLKCKSSVKIEGLKDWEELIMKDSSVLEARNLGLIWQQT